MSFFPASRRAGGSSASLSQSSRKLRASSTVISRAGLSLVIDAATRDGCQSPREHHGVLERARRRKLRRLRLVLAHYELAGCRFLWNRLLRCFWVTVSDTSS